MRLAVLAVVLASTAVTAAAAPPKPPIVWQNRVVKPAPGVALAAISNKLYLNDCRNSSCSLTPGGDDSLTNRSSIPINPVIMNAYPHGDAHWESLVSCVRETFLPFKVEIVTTDPGAESHFEVMIGGDSRQLRPDLDAGGVAPFISCGASRNNIISFVFPDSSSDLEFLCGAVVQEAAHVWGLDHELNAKDPLTYLELGTLKRFQDDDARCGEFEPRNCFCGGTTQNSYQYMADTFGPVDLRPASLAITSPKDGAWVKPGFAVNAVLTSQLSGKIGKLTIDDRKVQELQRGPYMFTAPTDIAGGDHTVTVTATDAMARTVTASALVHVTAVCRAGKCDDGLTCFGGYCVPGADVAGGVGSTCTTGDECVTGMCGSDGTESRCTGPCDDGACPSGFECRGGDFCWPGDGGGCGASGSSPGFLLFALAGIAFVLRRRR